MKLPPYTLSKQKKILGLLKKKIFQIINSKNVLVNIQIFSSRFVDKSKNAV